MTTKSWDSLTNSVVATDFTWNTESSALLSNGTFDYVYGQNPNLPISQVDTVDGYSSELLTDPITNVRAIVEVSSGSADPYVLDNYTDYDDYGNPMTEAGGSANVGGLTRQIGSDPDSATNLAFGGGFQDSTGYIYFVHRPYDSIIGQFDSVDSGTSGTWSPYSYVADAPTSQSDSPSVQATSPAAFASLHSASSSGSGSRPPGKMHLGSDSACEWAGNRSWKLCINQNFLWIDIPGLTDEYVRVINYQLVVAKEESHASTVASLSILTGVNALFTWDGIDINKSQSFSPPPTSKSITYTRIPSWHRVWAVINTSGGQWYQAGEAWGTPKNSGTIGTGCVAQGPCPGTFVPY